MCIRDSLDASDFQNGADRTAGDYAGTFGSRTQQHTASAEHTDGLVRNGGAFQSNAMQVLLGVLAAFANGLGNLARFTQTETHDAVAVADNDQSGELEDSRCV